MPNLLVWHTGNTNPSITETITAGGTAVNISAASAKTFSMRPVGSSTLTVAAAAAAFVTDGSDGALRYDWTSGDVDTPGRYLVWWTVTISGDTQDVGEAIIEIRDHAPVNGYVELEEFKSTAELSQESFADGDIATAIVAASRAVDLTCNRRFWKDPSAVDRYFTPTSARLCRIDDLADFTSLALDLDGDGTYETTTWVENTDYVFQPLNAETDGWPRTRIALHPRNHTSLVAYPRSVKVNGKFGWDAVPYPVVQATTIIASKLVKRSREAPFGVVALGLDGAAVRISRIDPDVNALLDPYVRPVA